MIFRCKGLLLVLMLYCSWSSASAKDRVVLVAAENSRIGSLSSFDLRKIYLGFKLYHQPDKPIKPIINSHDKHLEQVFLQNIVAMSERSYNHRLLSLTLRRGIPRPETIPSLKKLHQELMSHPESVSYMWQEDAKKFTGLKILRVLWQKN